MQFTYGQTGMAGKRWIVSGRSLPGLSERAKHLLARALSR